jgi:hypothetical protein
MVFIIVSWSVSEYKRPGISAADSKKPLKQFRFKGFVGGIKWARTIDLHDVNVAL